MTIADTAFAESGLLALKNVCWWVDSFCFLGFVLISFSWFFYPAGPESEMTTPSIYPENVPQFCGNRLEDRDHDAIDTCYAMWYTRISWSYLAGIADRVATAWDTE